MQKKCKKKWLDAVLSFLRQSPPETPVLSGVSEAVAPVLLFREFLADPERSLLVAVPDLNIAERTVMELNSWSRVAGVPLRVRLLPETLHGKMVFTGGEAGRARALLASLTEPTDILVGSVHALTAACPPPEKLLNSEFTLRPGMKISPAELAEKLVKLDYDDELEVHVSGEFSRRGGLMDIFSPGSDVPCRVEFFGDEIDTLRFFSPDSQRSTGAAESYRVIAPHPSSDALLAGDEAVDFFAYWENRPCRLISLFPEDCESMLRERDDQALLKRFVEVMSLRGGRRFSALAEGTPAGCFPPLAHLAGKMPKELQYATLELMREVLFSQLRQWLEIGYTVTMLAPDEASLRHLNDWLEEHDLVSGSLETDVASPAGGVLLPSENQVILTERELFTMNAFGRKAALPEEEPDEDGALPAKILAPSELRELGEMRILSDLDEGDYAVHMEHGIAIFRGIADSVSPQGVKREMMKLEFAGNTILQVPLSRAGQVSRYLGASGKIKLHKLGGSIWKKEREFVSGKVRDYAADMLKLQAVRSALPGIAFPPAGPEEKHFEESFLYRDTPDQHKATSEIRRDMETRRPMDRLLCGDVGYGKTEVAMRAAFKAVQNGYQVAVLAPTTVLVQQHFNSFRERFAPYPFVIGQLSRFCTPMEKASVLGRLSTGGIDIVIGTHSLCGALVDFANLGLVIIDEEQRFGVRQKEQLRRLRTEVDVLTLSATPIPRTLYLAMAGARDLSTLQTAPRERLPVRTVVAPEDPGLIANAIKAEVARGGQVYYLHNRVKTIEECRDKLAAAMPGVRFGVAHGQMDETELAQVMHQFVDGSLDCLVCSTIIESGIDIPNANTIIIERADRFGLSQLYQLRGRVGRRNHQAYAYMLLPRHSVLSGDARKRIAAIRRCSNLGAGLQLSLHDLEIRGSGNLLGAEQSGHLNLIGFDLYCYLLKREVALLKGEVPEIMVPAQVSVDFVVYGYEAQGKDLLPAGFPPSYIDGTRPRVAAYRRLDRLQTVAQLQDFRAELIDRYGKLPSSAETLLKISEIRIIVSAAGYEELTVAEGKVLIRCGHAVYRQKDGRVPVMDPRNPAFLRLALLKKIAQDAAAERRRIVEEKRQR